MRRLPVSSSSWTQRASGPLPLPFDSRKSIVCSRCHPSGSEHVVVNRTSCAGPLSPAAGLLTPLLGSRLTVNEPTLVGPVETWASSATANVSVYVRPLIAAWGVMFQLTMRPTIWPAAFFNAIVLDTVQFSRASGVSSVVVAPGEHLVVILLPLLPMASVLDDSFQNRSTDWN